MKPFNRLLRPLPLRPSPISNTPILRSTYPPNHHLLPSARSSIPRHTHSRPVRKRPYSTTTRRLASSQQPVSKAQPPPPYPQNPTSHSSTAPISSTSSSAPPPLPPQSQSLTQRLRKLSREYGYSAFGVYLLLTALDFPICFAAVRYIGADRVGHYEHVILSKVGEAIPESMKEGWRGVKGAVKGAFASASSDDGSPAASEQKEGGQIEVSERTVGEERYSVVGSEFAADGAVRAGDIHGVVEAEKLNQGENASEFTSYPLPFLPLPFLFPVLYMPFKDPSKSPIQPANIYQVYGPNSPSPTPSTNPSFSSAFP